MSKIKWDADSERLYETGVDRAVIYPKAADGSYPKGVGWNGVTNYTESPQGGEANPIYADNQKYLNLRSAETLDASIECYTYPPEFAECNGELELAKGIRVAQQARKSFGLCVRTLIGNDVAGTDYGYRLHLVYGVDASPSERAYDTVNDDPEAISFSYDLTTTPVSVKGMKPTSLLTIDSTQVEATKLKALEDILYGTDAEGETAATEARLPLPDEVAALFANG